MGICLHVLHGVLNTSITLGFAYKYCMWYCIQVLHRALHTSITWGFAYNYQMGLCIQVLDGALHASITLALDAHSSIVTHISGTCFIMQ